MTVPAKEISACIESTLIAPNATRADVEKLCAEARAKSYHAVCVNGSRIELARAILEESPVQVVALIGFPFGGSDPDAKRYETEIAIDHGAQEIDFVVNIGALKDCDKKYVLREMRDIAEAADERPVKAALDTRLLTRDEKILACQLALDSGVQFVGAWWDFHAPIATVEDVQLLRETLGADFGIKAIGNIRDIDTVQKLLSAGATRIGVLAGQL